MQKWEWQSAKAGTRRGTLVEKKKEEQGSLMEKEGALHFHVC